MKSVLVLCVTILHLATGQQRKPDVEGSCSVKIDKEWKGVIASPGFPHADYGNDLLCTYEITAPVGMQITFRSLYLNLEPPGINQAEDGAKEECFDAVNIHYVVDDNTTSRVEQYCGEARIYADATPGNKLLVEFFSDGSVTSDGFAIEWIAMDRNEMPPQLNCNFDEAFALCPGWSQVTGDDFDWTFARGSTPTQGTGPDFDSNTGTNEGRYAHIEASGVASGSVAKLITPPLKGDVDYCLKFDYHSYGDGTGTLAVMRRFGVDEEELKWISGEPTDQVWWPVSITLPESFFSSQIVFEATRGPNYRSDIAIDDVTFAVGVCEDNSTDQQLIESEAQEATLEPQTSPVCGRGHFACLRSNECITLDRVCDDIIDCRHGSDEDGCFPEWCPGNMYWGGCVAGCNRTCEDGPAPPPCGETCVGRCTCPDEAPVLHDGTCIAFDECPDHLVKDGIIRHAKEKVHGEIMELFKQIANDIEQESQ